MKGKKIAIVGGAGFIGHQMACYFTSLGAIVHTIDNLQVNNLGAFSYKEEEAKNRSLYLNILNTRLDMLREKNIPLHIIDARDYHLLTRCLHAIKPDYVVHLSAIAHANQANKDPLSTFDHSARTLENALDISSRLNTHFIYFSSSMVYGDFNGGTVTEESPCNPIGIYGALKLGGEKLVIAYNQTSNMAYTIVRPSAAYGPGDVGRRVAQAFLENALQGKDIVIDGDGSDRIDFTYIKDLIHGVRLVIENKNSIGQIFNITCGNGRSLKELADILLTHVPGAKVTYGVRNKLMPKRGTLSIEKAGKLLGYNSQYQLERGYAEYITWYKDHLLAFLKN